MREKIKTILVIIAILLIFAIIFFSDPESCKLIPKCPFFIITGYYCPGCGTFRSFYCPGCGTFRSLHNILHGNFSGAIRANILTVILLPFITYSLINRFIIAIKKQPLPEFHIPAILIWILFGIVIAYWVLRNVNIYPFYLLSPH
jgi:hypothetical protein